jgi:hypothetical protein
MWTGTRGESLTFDPGINCEGKLVIDVDDRDGRTGKESFASLASEHGLDLDTAIASTPSDGRHYFYKLPPGVDPTTVKSGSDKLGSGIDHRSYNGLVVGAGTVRPGKGEYKWRARARRSPDETEMKLAPMSLIELCRREHIREPHEPTVMPGLELDTPDAVERFRQYAAECGPEAVEGAGGRNITMAILRRAGDYGLSYSAATEVICEEGGWNETKAYPPWDEGELLELGESLEPSRERPIGCDHPSSHFDHVEIGEEDEAVGGDKGVSGTTSANGDEAAGNNNTADGNNEAPCNNKALPFWSFDSDEAPAPKGWIIKSVAAKGETAGWIGPPGSGKSAIVLDWLMHCATGRDWRGHKCRRARSHSRNRPRLRRRRASNFSRARHRSRRNPIRVATRTRR